MTLRGWVSCAVIVVLALVPPIVGLADNAFILDLATRFVILAIAAVSLNPGIIDTEMMRSCLPEMAPGCIKPDSWSRGMVDFLLKLGPSDNGKALSAP